MRFVWMVVFFLVTAGCATTTRVVYLPAPPQSRPAPGGATSGGGLRELDSNYLKGYAEKAAEYRRVEGEAAARADHSEAAAIADRRNMAAYQQELVQANQYNGGHVSVSPSYAASGQPPYRYELVCRSADLHHRHIDRCYRYYQQR